MNEWYLKDLSRKLRSAQRAKSAQGYALGQPPLTEAWDEHGPRILEMIPIAAGKFGELADVAFREGGAMDQLIRLLPYAVELFGIFVGKISYFLQHPLLSIANLAGAPGELLSGRLDAWEPEPDDRLRVRLLARDWLAVGDDYALDCGEFVVDAPSGSIFPCTCSLNGVSQPSDEGFMETRRTQTWQNVTIEKIAGDMAQRAGLSLDYEAPEINIKVKEQKDTPDCFFLQGLCKDYGLCMKVYSNRLVIYDREMYKKRPAAVILDAGGDFGKLSYQRMQHGTYTGGKLVYNDAGKEEKIEASLGGGKRILTVTKKADDQRDAEAILRGKLNVANHSARALSFSLSLLRIDICAAMCVQVDGLGSKWSGKYFIDTITHTLGGVSSGKMSKVEAGF